MGHWLSGLADAFREDLMKSTAFVTLAILITGFVGMKVFADEVTAPRHVTIHRVLPHVKDVLTNKSTSRIGANACRINRKEPPPA